MDAARVATDEPSRKKAKSQGCTVDGCLSVAKTRDPNTGHWYCAGCFRNVRPDFDATFMRCQPASKPDRRIVGKTPPPVVPRGQPNHAPRCFVCHSGATDIVDFVCGTQRSQSCGAARLCADCRGARDVTSCFSCFGKHKSGRCYRCDERCEFDGERRLCLRCRREGGAIQCYFCGRHRSSVELRRCSSATCDGRHPGPLTCATCFEDVQGCKAFCRSCFARDWKGRCYRCSEKWAHRSQSQYCRKCHGQLFRDPVDIAIDVFASLPPSEWYSRWGPEWFRGKRVGMKIPYTSSGGRSKLAGPSIIPWEDRREENASFTLDEEMCLAIAEKVPTWGRHLQRLCGKFEGRVSLVQRLLVNIMGCQFQYEGEALTSRWEGGLVPGFCFHQRRQLTWAHRCRHARCHGLQAPRQPGKLCFMELIEAVAEALPRRLAIGDSIHTASWGEFVVVDDFSKIWLNDYSSYFASACGSSWGRAVAIYVGGHPGAPRNEWYRSVSTYMCLTCGEDRAAGGKMHAMCSDVKFAIHKECPAGGRFCLECWRQLRQRDSGRSETPCQYYCGWTHAVDKMRRGGCASKILAGAVIRTGPEYIWGETIEPGQCTDDDV